MKNVRQNELADRRSAAADAKASLLKAYQAARTVAAPLQAAKQAERASLIEAREARRVERDRLKHEERVLHETKAAEEQAVAEHAATADARARASAENTRIARVIEDEAARKAERDKRYANRKARQA